MTLEQKMEVELVDIIAAMMYQTRLNVECLDQKVKKIRPSNLKDVVLLYNENQKNWDNKFIRACKRVGLDHLIKRDFKSEELAYYSVCCEFLRESKDLSSISDIIEVAKNLEDITPVLSNIKAILFNQLQKEKSNEKE